MIDYEQKIKQLEERITELEKKVDMIYNLENSERVKTYIDKSNKAKKLVELMATASGDNSIVETAEQSQSASLQEQFGLSDIEDAVTYIEQVDTAFEKAEQKLDEEIDNNTDISVFEYSQVDGGIRIDTYIGFDNEETVRIPNTINGLPVIEIGEKAFYSCKNLKNVIFPNNLKTIGKNSFSGCEALLEVDLPNSITKIGNSAFALCYSVTTLSFPNSLMEIEDRAFYECNKLSIVKFAKGLQKIGSCAFEGSIFSHTNIKNIDLPQGLKEISSKVFNSTYLTDLRIPDSVISIGENIAGRRITIYCNPGSYAMKYARENYHTVKPYNDFDKL